MRGTELCAEIYITRVEPMSGPVRLKSRFTPQEIHFSLTTVTAPYANRVAEMPRGNKGARPIPAGAGTTEAEAPGLGHRHDRGQFWSLYGPKCPRS